MRSVGRRAMASMACVGAAALLGVAGVGCGGDDGSDSSSSSSAGPITIGLSAPMSGSQSSLGEEYKAGIDLAVEELNAKGGVLGRQIKLRIVDNQCDAAIGANAARTLGADDNVVAFVGSICSPSTLAALPIIQREQIVELDAGSTSPDVAKQSGVGGNKWSYRLNIDDGIMAEILAEIIGERVKSVAIIGSNDDYGRGAAAAIKQDLQPAGVKVVGEAYYTRGSHDFRSMLTKVDSQDPEGLVVIGDYTDTVPMARQAKELGLGDLPVFGRGTVISDTFNSLLKDPSVWDGAIGVDRWTPTNDSEAFTAAFQQANGRKPIVFNALPYYAMHVLAEAIQKAGSTDRAAIEEALSGLSMCIDGLGHVQFDDHHQAHTNAFVIQRKANEIKTREERPTGDNTTTSCA